jgi:hypothetical protein
MRHPEQCRIGSHQYGTLIDAHGQRLCELCGEPSDYYGDEDDDTDFLESNDMEDTLDYLLDQNND